MLSKDHSTRRQNRLPVALVVGGTPDLAGFVEAAAEIAGLLATRCSTADASTVATEVRPFALVMDHETYDCDPTTFEALASSVASTVLLAKVDEESPASLAIRLQALLDEPVT